MPLIDKRPIGASLDRTLGRPRVGDVELQDAWDKADRRRRVREAEEARWGKARWHRHLAAVYAMRSEEHGRIADSYEGIKP